MTDESKDCMPKLRFKSPKPWNSYSLDGIFEFKKNATNSREDLTEEGNLYYIHYGDIHTKYDGFIDFSKDNIPYLKGNIPVKADFIYNGDIIIADASEDEEGVGKTVEVSNLYGDKKAISGLHTVVLRPHKNIFSPFFASYLFSSAGIKKQFLKIATGMKVYSLAKSALKGVNLVFPSLAEQQKIADCLSSLDELIEAHEQKRDALIEHKKGLMQRLFPAEGETTPRWRFPEFRKGMEWVTAPLDTLVKTIPPPKKILTEYYEKSGKIPIIDQSKEKISGYTNDDESIINIASPVIIFGDHTCIVKYVDFNFAQGADGIKILLPLNIVPRFLYEYLCFSPVIPTGYSRHFSTLKEKNIYFPSTVEEQQKIADCLSSLDARIEAEEAEIASLREHKQGLMQQLFPAIFPGREESR